MVRILQHSMSLSPRAKREFEKQAPIYFAKSAALAGSTGPGKLTPVLKEGYRIKQAAEQGSGDVDDDESCELLEASETDVFNWSGQTEQNGQGDSDADDDESGELLDASDTDVFVVKELGGGVV